MEYNSTYLYLISKQMWSRNDSSQSSLQHIRSILKMHHDLLSRRLYFHLNHVSDGRSSLPPILKWLMSVVRAWPLRLTHWRPNSGSATYQLRDLGPGI